MARGVDIYRYQTVTDWRTFADGIDFAWVKLTDGFGPAVVRGDRQVNGCKGAGIPVGGYHYAQRGDPIRQARVFASELRRLGALDLAPALDLEAPFTPGSEARDFAITFLREIMNYGWRPTVYMSASWAAVLRPDRWGIPGLVIWIAAYGTNDGRRYPSAVTAYYTGRCDVHQYTSVGRVPGISGNVDLNHAHAGVPRNTTTSSEETDMTPEESRKLDELWDKLLPGEAERKSSGVIADYIRRAMLAAEKSAALLAADKGVDEQALAAAIVSQQRDLLADVVREVVPDDIAEGVVQRLGERLNAMSADTPPVSS